MKFIRFFNNINKSDVSLAGGKGASLGEMFNCGIPVPEGFVILSSTFDEFIFSQKLDKEINRILEKVNVKDQKTITLASKKIQALILSKSISKDLNTEILSSFKKLNSSFVAVRSSATSEDSKDDAWAGQLNTYLNTTSNNLILNIKKCWASLFTERAIFYRFEKKLENKKISVAVVIQKMVESEKSGIAFSVHPVTEDYNQLIIEAGFGLGEAIVSGQVTPNSYIVSKKPHRILDKTISEQARELVRSEKREEEGEGGIVWKNISKERASSQVLEDKEILSLSSLIQKIESHYGFPVDVEWAIEKNKIYITQSRPITTLKEKEKIIFELEFQRETSIYMFDIWLKSYLNVCKNIFHWKDRSYERVFGIYDSGIIKGYTIKDDLKLMEDSIKKMDVSSINKLIQMYKNDYKLLLQNPDKIFDKTFTIKLFSGFIITLILGNINNHKLQSLAISIRENTEKLFPIIQETLQAKAKSELVRYDELISTAKIINTTSRSNCIIDNLGINFNLGSYLDKNNLTILNPNKKLDLTLLFSREPDEFTLFRLSAGYDSMTIAFPTIVDEKMNNTCFVFNNQGLVGAYYDMREIQSISQKIIELSIKDPEDIKKRIITNIKQFDNLYNKFKDSKNKIKTLDELKSIQHFCSDNWMYMQLLTVLPTLPVSEELKEIAFKMRVKSQEYNLVIQKAITSFLETKYAYLKNKSNFVLPSEVWSKDVDNKNLMLERISKREKGYVYYKGKIYTGSIDSILNELNIVLQKEETNTSEVDNKIELHKEHSREYSLSRMHAWYRGFSYYFTKIDLVGKGLEHTTFIYTGKDLVDVYYDNKELLDVFKIIETSANKNFKLVEKSVNRLLNLLEVLKPYFNKAKKIKTIQEYKKVIELYGEYWAEIAVAFVLPESNFKVSSKIKKLTLDARTKTQEYNEALEPVISEFIENKYKYLKGNSRFVLPEDIFNGDINNKNKMLNIIAERKKGFVYYQGKLYTGDVNENLDKLNLFLEKQETSVQEIKGQIGYKGKVTGIVRIITSKNQISDFKTGEIMVSAMTMPNYLPAMKKASAFVTDEGGITSHAAIVARELKKPCVIGTKIATEVLKTGDLIEVDADNGVVRLLKKEK